MRIYIKYSKNQERILIIIILHENAQYAIHYQGGIVIHVMQIFVKFIFTMKDTRNYVAYSRIQFNL